MAKLTKAEYRNHQQALEILQQSELSDTEKEFVLSHYHEAATHINSKAGAFFTPLPMAWEFAHDAGNDYRDTRSFIDLCAGIGVLAYTLVKRYPLSRRLVCVEINPEYVEVGRKLVPEADWYCMDVTDLDAVKNLGEFKTAVANPPFGQVPTFHKKQGPLYKGGEAEYTVIDIASMIACNGVFILPQESAGYRYSGRQYYERLHNEKYLTFANSTGLHLDTGIGTDTTAIPDVVWKGVSPRVEFACVNFLETEIPAQTNDMQLDLFAAL
jgi:hypothetical protein